MTRILAGLALCLLGAQEPAPAVPRDRLPVLGTVGDLPPEGERVILEVTAKGALAADGRAMDLDGVRQVLGPKADALREPGRPSGLHVVLRIDRSLRWGDLQEVLRTLDDPRLRIHRILFAAVPEDRGEEGAMAAFQPVDGPAEGELRPLPVVLSATRADAAPGTTVYRRLARELAAEKPGDFVASVTAASGVSSGAVLETMDALLRWGARGVVFPLQLSKVPKPAVPEPAVGWPRVTLLGSKGTPAGTGDPALPPVARIRGRMAGQTEPPPSIAPSAHSLTGPFAGRAAAGAFDAEGGDGTGAAVAAGLDWLARHQSPGGFFDADGFEAQCRGAKCGGTGGPLYDPGVTGLALLAFQGTGETHKSPRHGHVVRNGLKYLKAIQDAEGCFGTRQSHHFVYNHALATLAFADAYALTESPLFKASAQKGIDFIRQCRNPYLAWRYGVKPRDNDTSVTAWMVWALDVGRTAGLDMDPEDFVGAKAWLDKVTEPEHGRAGYTARGNGPARPQELMDRFPADRSESLTALAVLTRMHGGADASDPMVKKGLELLRKSPPSWSARDGSTDFYYWHFGTMALFHAGGDRWTAWNGALKKALLGNQKRGPGDDARGSWDPADPWASEGGRIYSTAINVLTLETPYRYPRRGVPR